MPWQHSGTRVAPTAGHEPQTAYQWFFTARSPKFAAVTGESKKGPAIRKLVADALMLKRWEELARKFITGEWGVELKGFDAAQAADRQADSQGEERWRD